MAVETAERNNTNNIKGECCFGKWNGNIIFRGIVIFLLLAILITFILILVVLSDKSNPSTESTADQHQMSKLTHPNVKVNISGKLTIITRREWLAKPSTGKPNALQLPVPYVIITHTASKECKSQADCTLDVRYIQSLHMDTNNWSDIGHNFLVGGDGFAYEGRGWKSEDAQTSGYDSRSIGIAFIGTFDDVPPPQVQMNAAKQLIEYGVENASIAKNYKLLAAHQVSDRHSPELMLYEEIKKWPHWSPSP